MMSSWDGCQNNKSTRRILIFCSLIVWKHGQKEKAELPVEHVWTKFRELTWLTAKLPPGAESWTQWLAGVEEGSCPLTPGDAWVEAAGILKASRKPGDGSVGQLVYLCFSGHGAGHSEPVLGTAMWPGLPGRDGHTVLCSRDPSHSWSHLTAQPEAPRGFRDWCCGCRLMDSCGSPRFERDLRLQGGSINSFWSRSQLSCQGNTLGAAQGLCL